MSIALSLSFVYVITSGDATNSHVLLPGDAGLDAFGFTTNSKMVTEVPGHWYMSGVADQMDDGWAMKMSNADFSFQSSLSTISIEIDGSVATEFDDKKEFDMFFGIGDGSKYISYLFDLDGGVLAGDRDGTSAGSWSYPACGQGMASGNVGTLLDHWHSDLLNGMSPYTDVFWSLRGALAEGDSDNWSIFSSEVNGKDAWPYLLEITNDVENNQVTFRQKSKDLDVSCTFDGAFDVDTPITIGLMPDAPDDVNIESIALTRAVSGPPTCSVSICAHGDNSLEIWASTDGAAYVQVADTTDWDITAETELTDIVAPTTLRFQVDDNDHRGGLLATVRVQCSDGYDQTFITDDGNSNFDVVYSLSGNRVMSEFHRFGYSWNDNWDSKVNAQMVQCMDPEAFWMWNGVDADNVVFELDLFPEEYYSYSAAAPLFEGRSSVDILKSELSKKSPMKMYRDHIGHHVDHEARNIKPEPEPEPESWTVTMTGKDLVIWALVAVNAVVLTVLCAVCTRSSARGKRRKYQVVKMVADTDLEESAF